MSWYSGLTADSGDNIGIPWLNDISHNVTGKLGLPDPWMSLYGDPAKKQKAALQAAADQMHALAAQERGYQMQGLDKALSFYAPAQQDITTLYGTPGTQNTVASLKAKAGK